MSSIKDGKSFISKRLTEMKEEVVKEKDFPIKDKPIADELVTHLSKLLIDKKALDKAFGSQEKAEKWADDRKLTSDQKRIMIGKSFLFSIEDSVSLFIYVYNMLSNPYFIFYSYAKT
jgi:hypothetical protein